MPALSLHGSSALVIGASGGIGEALARTLHDDFGASVERLSRQATGFDLADEASIEAAAWALATAGKSFSVILVATGILDTRSADGTISGPEKAFQELQPAAMIQAFAVNAAGPALVFKHFAKLLTPGQPALFAALSARVGSIGDNRLGGWMSYRASKAALNQFIRCAGIEHKRREPVHVVVALHPGTIPTPLTEKYAKGRYTALPEDAAHKMITTLLDLTPQDSGYFFAYDGTRIEW